MAVRRIVGKHKPTIFILLSQVEIVPTSCTSVDMAQFPEAHMCIQVAVYKKQDRTQVFGLLLTTPIEV